MIFLLIDFLIAAACLALGHSAGGGGNCSALPLLLRLVGLGVESSVLQFVFSISICGVDCDVLGSFDGMNVCECVNE